MFPATGTGFKEIFAFTDEFLASEIHQSRWKAFLKKKKALANVDLEEVVSSLKTMLLPIVDSIASGTEYVFKVYCMRRRIIQGLTSAENKNFPQLVKSIPELEKAENKKDKMFEILSSQESNLRLPNDIELTRYMETMNFYNFGYCKFYLAMIEESLTKSRPELTDERLQIEHILPKTLNAVWAQALGDNAEEIHSELVNTIGNLTLIRHNQELGQKEFSFKKEVYENNAGLQIARKEITNNETWNAETIKHRTEWITEYLLTNVLTIPDKMRKTNNFNVKETKGVSFQNLQLIGLDIHFVQDPTIVAHVVSDKEVEFEGKRWRLSPLTKELMERKGISRPSGSYNGFRHWAYDDIILSEV